VADLEALAVQSGAFSRFRVDPRIPDAQFEQLYRTWVRNSIRREMADEVLVVREGQRTVGFLTLKADGESGRIELLAVDVESRGKGYGVELVRAAEECFRAMGCDSGSVVTQAANRPACRLYRKCGYEIVLTEYFYHFWL
jgi:dTDP-4-amino-4,6-dideoxy-D-galactose acyltransferase